MSLSITLDWISFTFKEHTREKEAWIREYADTETSIPVSPRNGYREACTDKNGLLQMWNVDRQEMGHHVIISGSCIRNLLEHRSVSQSEILHSVMHAGGSITRLDLAKDAQNVPMDYGAIWACLEQREYTGSAQNTARLQGSDGGNTIYIGSRTSERFVRLYDKAAQTGNNGVLWARLEIECKGMVARALAVALCHSANWSAIFNTTVLRMAHIQRDTDMDYFFSDTPCVIGLPKIEKRADTEAWIEKQVISAIAKHYVEHPDSFAIQLLRVTLDMIDQQNKRDLQSD